MTPPFPTRIERIVNEFLTFQEHFTRASRLNLVSATAEPLDLQPFISNFAAKKRYQRKVVSLPNLSETIKEQFEREIQSPVRILPTNSATYALFIALTGLSRVGGTIFCFEPDFFLHHRWALICNVEFVQVPLHGPGTIYERLLHAERTHGKPDVVLFSNPTNPGGDVWPREELMQLLEYQDHSNCAIIADEVYKDFVYDSTTNAYSMGTLTAHPKVVRVYSLNKYTGSYWLSMGWLAVHPEVADGFLALVDATIYLLPILIQELVIDVIGSESLWERVRAVNRRCLANRNRLGEALGGQVMWNPRGGMYACLSTPNHMSGTHFARILAEKHDIGVLPGEDFGPSAKGTVRLCLEAEEETFGEAAETLAGLY